MANPINPTTGKEYTIAELMAKVAELEAQAAAKNTLFMGVSEETGVICLYGLQKFPVSLHREQWERVISPETQALVKGFISNPDVITLTPGKASAEDAKKNAATLRKASQKQLNGLPIVRRQSAETKAKFAKASA